MTACRACCEALKTNAVDMPVDANKLMRVNRMLDALEGSGGGSCVKAHVCAVRALLQDAAAAAAEAARKRPSIVTVSRSKHCNHCRWMLKTHITSFEKEEECDLLTFDSLKTLVDWMCSQKGEELRENDPKTYDDVLASFQWRAREQLQLESCRNNATQDVALRKVATMV